MADEPEPDMTIGELRTHVDTRFARTDQRFDEVDRRFTEIDQRFDEVDRRFTEVDRRFTEVDRRFDELERRIAAEHAETRRHFEVVAERLEGHLRLFAERGDVDHQRLEDHETRIRTLEKRRR
jgi:septal ring factor EnvC (AmiA/AmiB activator)